MSCLKYIKIYIKAAPICIGVTVTPSSGSALIRSYTNNPYICICVYIYIYIYIYIYTYIVFLKYF